MDIDPRAQAERKFATCCDPEILPDVIGRYATDSTVAVRTLVDALRPAASPDHARVCELGPGYGWLPEELGREFRAARLHALDRSPAMLAATRDAAGPGITLVRGDMEALPFRDAAFDAIVTNWTLYFMANIDAALADIARCLRRGGVFVAATNARDHMREFWDLAAAAVRESTQRDPERDISDRFDLTSGPALVRRQFPGFEVREWSGVMRVPDVETLLRLWPGYGPQELSPDENARARDTFARLAGGHIRRDGAFVMTRHGGAFVARRG